MAMWLRPDREWTSRQVEQYREWCIAGPSGRGEEIFTAWQQRGARMRELLKANPLLSPREASRMWEREHATD